MSCRPLSIGRCKNYATTVPYITNAVKVLEARGYLQRQNNTQDNRSKLLILNPDFAPRCRDIEAALRKGLKETLYASIEPREFAVYMKVLYQLGEAVKARSK